MDARGCTDKIVSLGETMGKAYGSFEKGGFALSDRLDAVRHRWALERHDLMEAAQRADADQRTAAKHTRDDRADAHTTSA